MKAPGTTDRGTALDGSPQEARALPADAPESVDRNLPPAREQRLPQPARDSNPDASAGRRFGPRGLLARLALAFVGLLTVAGIGGAGVVRWRRRRTAGGGSVGPAQQRAT